MNKKLNEKYLKKMNELEQKYGSDTEKIHISADCILCDLLEELGYTELVKKFDSLNMWYA